jgi:hypothetical protein
MKEAHEHRALYTRPRTHAHAIYTRARAHTHMPCTLARAHTHMPYTLARAHTHTCPVHSRPRTHTHALYTICMYVYIFVRVCIYVTLHTKPEALNLKPKT